MITGSAIGNLGRLVHDKLNQIQSELIRKRVEAAKSAAATHWLISVVAVIHVDKPAQGRRTKQTRNRSSTAAGGQRRS